MRLFQMIAAVFLNLLLLPFFGVAWLGLLVSRLGKALSTMQPEIKFTPLPAKEFRKATIVILNWNGRHLLEENLSSVIQAAHANGGGH